jgi:hypothetical protein
LWPVANHHFALIISPFYFSRLFSEGFQSDLVDQAKVENFQVMWQYIGTVGTRLKPVAGKIGTG